jgi:hypothetical protein
MYKMNIGIEKQTNGIKCASILVSNGIQMVSNTACLVPGGNCRNVL